MPKLTRHNGAAIKAFRTIRGWKPGEFANRSLISYPHLDNLEKERKEASLEVLYRIALALNVEPEAIVRDPTFLVPRSIDHASPQQSGVQS